MHIGCIMDGNRRWARGRGIAQALQHVQGAKNTQRIVQACYERGVDVVSLWALAVKNIQERSAEELENIYDLLCQQVSQVLPKMIEKDIRFAVVGDMDLLPEHVVDVLHDACEKTSSGKKMTVILAVAYGGQNEILRAVKACLKDGVDPDTLTESEFASRYLDSGRFAPPDLIIRTGCSGRQRTSGYLLWGSEYSELYFTETCWPDFDEGELERAIAHFEGAQRNFGK